jgi:hypothetical protein
MTYEIFFISNPMIRKARLPDGHLRFQAERESSLDELDRLLERYIVVRGDEGMKMVGHDDKFVEQIFALVPIMPQDLNKQVGGHVALEKSSPLGGHGGNEESSIHGSNVAFPHGGRCAGSHVEIVRFLDEAVLVEEWRFNATFVAPLDRALASANHDHRA